MAILYSQQKKTQRNLMIVFALVFLVTVFVIWQGFFKKGTGLLPGGKLKPSRAEIKMNFEILKNPLLGTLQPFSDIQPFKPSTTTKGTTIIEEKVGRENPFIPY